VAVDKRPAGALENYKDRTTMINDEDLRAIRNSACAAWGITIAVIVVIAVIVKLL
jgi:t-SNARE complex subunit (syntaxin)